jgi:hypothetical protein
MSKKTDPNASTAKELRVKGTQGEDAKVVLAKTALRPSVRAAITTQAYSKQFGDLDLTALVDELAAHSNAASKGEMARAEGMLMSQAHTLEAIFHELARRAALNMGEYINAAEIYMRLALKAQSQCRATLETLATIKNPAPVTFVRQANVAHGPQQVNNGMTPANERSRARESENQPSKLLEQQRNEWMDTRATQAPIDADSAVAPVGEVDGTANAAR